MDNRKLIAFGTNSYVISLPKEWVESNKLKKGDPVNIMESQGEIILSVARNNEQKPEEITICLDGKNFNYVSAEIVTSYLKGYDSITLNGTTLGDILPELRKLISTLSGLEIMNLTSDTMDIKNLLNERNVSVREITLRTHNMLLSMLEDTLKCLEKDLHKAILERDNDVNRMVFLSSRVLHKALKDQSFAREAMLSPVEIMVEWLILITMEKIGDQTKRIARDLKEHDLKAKSKEALKEMFALLITNYKDVMKAYELNDKPTLFRISTEIKEEMTERGNRFISGSNVQLEMKIIENFKNMASAIEHIAQYALRAD